MNLIPQTVIVVNPVHAILARKPNPFWTCKHIGITIISKAHLLYQCTICYPPGYIRAIPSFTEEEVAAAAAAAAARAEAEAEAEAEASETIKG